MNTTKMTGVDKVRAAAADGGWQIVTGARSWSSSFDCVRGEVVVRVYTSHRGAVTMAGVWRVKGGRRCYTSDLPNIDGTNKAAQVVAVLEGDIK